MGKLRDAILLAEERKTAALGLPFDDREPGINFTTESQSRRVISGFDIDFQELKELTQHAGNIFAQMAMHLPLAQSHEAAWTEGLLIGLFAGSMSPASNAGDTEVTGQEE